MNLNPGDMFVVQNHNILGKLIQEVEDHILKDPGIYTHGGFVTSPDGTILESKLHYQYGKLSHYVGRKMLLVRHKEMTPERYAKGFDYVRCDIGKLYPVWRLPLYILGIEKYFHKGAGVCSEQCGKFLDGAGFNPEHIVYGVSPDDLAQMWKKTVAEGRMEIIFEGRLEL
jgi:hypothetical protein